ncbi:MAG: 2-oxo-tetronate isomerase [Alphaproteobacteria bacterium]
MPNFAANLSFMFQEMELPERYAAAAAVGFRAVEFLFPYDHEPALLAERREEAGLTQALFNVPPGDWQGGERGITVLPGREGEFQDGVGRALEYARALGCLRLHAIAGLVPEGADREAYDRVYRDNLRFAAAAAKAEGIDILIEPINDRDMAGYYLTTSAQARALIEELGLDNLFLQYDVYHAQIMEGDLARTIRDNLDIIRHFQISSVPDRHEPDEGEINYPFLFELIDESGYEGWVGCEYRPRGDTVAGLGWAKAYGIG